MKKQFKLIVLICLSLSVYFIYQKTNHQTLKVLSIGDSYSLGINSFGYQEYSYLDYYKNSFPKQNILINREYSHKELTISSLLEEIEYHPNIKKDLREANVIILHIGYNDLIYKMSIEEMNPKEFQKRMEEIQKEYRSLLKEISKYYTKQVIMIGYYQINQENEYYQKGIIELNRIIENLPNTIYIDTYYLLSDREKYFSNPHSNYPNYKGYMEIACKIIQKTLEMKTNI